MLFGERHHVFQRGNEKPAVFIGFERFGEHPPFGRRFGRGEHQFRFRHPFRGLFVQSGQSERFDQTGGLRQRVGVRSQRFQNVLGRRGKSVGQPCAFCRRHALFQIILFLQVVGGQTAQRGGLPDHLRAERASVRRRVFAGFSLLIKLAQFRRGQKPVLNQPFGVRQLGFGRDGVVRDKHFFEP